VGVLADAFMEAIEVITSRERTIHINGKTTTVLVWNPTVANL
jgi:hypothetical protein